MTLKVILNHCGVFHQLEGARCTLPRAMWGHFLQLMLNVSEVSHGHHRDHAGRVFLFAQVGLLGERVHDYDSAVPCILSFRQT